jgi:arabinogalactan oligomer/maltooligosaccharide transport system substrate-binding protein
MLKRLLQPCVAAAALLAAGAAWSQANELVVWHAYRGAEKSAFEKAVKLYESKPAAKGLKVNTLAIPFDAYADRISAAVPRGRGPDLFIYAQDRLGGWVEAGKTVEPIDFFVDKATRDRFLPGMMDAMTYGKSIYGLPLNYKSTTLIYNKAMIKTPPKTVAEMLKLAKQHTQADSGRYGLAYWYTNFYFHAALLNAYGGRVFDDGGKLTLNTPATVASIKQMMKWYRDDKVVPPEPSEALVASLFNEGKAAMVINGPWFVGEISPSVQYGLALLPVVDEAKRPMRPWLTIEGVYIAASSNKKEQAYDLAKFLTSDEAGLILAIEGRQLHTNKAVYQDKRVSGDPVLKAFYEQLANAEPMPNRAEMTMVWSPVTTAMNKIVKGAATPEAAIKEATDTIQDSINALRKSR